MARRSRAWSAGRHSVRPRFTISVHRWPGQTHAYDQGQHGPVSPGYRRSSPWRNAGKLERDHRPHRVDGYRPVWIDNVRVAARRRRPPGPVLALRSATAPASLPWPVDACGNRMEHRPAHMPRAQVVPFSVAGEQSNGRDRLSVGRRPLLWDEFSPALYNLSVSLATESGPALPRQPRSQLRHARFPPPRARSSPSTARRSSCAARTTAAAFR